MQRQASHSGRNTHAGGLYKTHTRQCCWLACAFYVWRKLRPLSSQKLQKNDRHRIVRFMYGYADDAHTASYACCIDNLVETRDLGVFVGDNGCF